MKGVGVLAERSLDYVYDYDYDYVGVKSAYV